MSPSCAVGVVWVLTKRRGLDDEYAGGARRGGFLVALLGWGAGGGEWLVGDQWRGLNNSDARGGGGQRQRMPMPTFLHALTR